jgi:hypothetical protein
MTIETTFAFTPTVSALLGNLTADLAPAVLEDGQWYCAEAVGDGLCYQFSPGSLAEAHYLTADFLLDGHNLAVLALELQEGASGPTFLWTFGLLNQCSARLRLPLEAVNQNRWRYEREGAYLKPTAMGDRVDLWRVDRLRLTVLRKSELPVRWCMTPLSAVAATPPRIQTPLLPKGPLIDRLGQSRLHVWPGKSQSEAEVSARLRAQLAAAPQQRWPEGFSRWGGDARRRLEATGFFRTQHDGKRWWLIDPDGHPFWSSGPNCVRVDTAAAYAGLEAALEWLPDAQGDFAAIFNRDDNPQPNINFLAANLIGAFGDDWLAQWATLALAELKRYGFNTVANWSEWRVAKAAGFPYVRPLDLEFHQTPLIFRDFPDVFDPAFNADAAAFAEALHETRDDPALIGYFLMNEPTWGFAAQNPAEGMLINTPSCATRQELLRYLQARYSSEAALQAAWGEGVTFTEVAEGCWRRPFSTAARGDLEAFSTVMVERLFGTLSAACRAVDPHHLNLGARYYTTPPTWALAGMTSFDVFSVNNYRERVDSDQLQPLSAQLQRPVMIGEWHFGAHDVGLPACGIGHVPNQHARGEAFRVYTEDAAAKPWCVGAHYFTLYDQSALGRFDGENYNIGFLDVCHRPYDALVQAAQQSHARLYRVASGEISPYEAEVTYLPRLFS